MSVSKYRFVSPGVFVNEIDNSQLPRAPEEMGPVIIGRCSRGPMMRPVKVQSFSDFVDVFGEPVAGGVGGDVWRDGNRLTPTYGAYAAQAYLKTSSPVTFVRLGGFEHEDSVTAGAAGWSMGKAWGLFIANMNVTDPVNCAPSGSAPLAAIIYADSNVSPVLSGDDMKGIATSGSAKWIKAAGQNGEFKLEVVGASTETINFNFDPNSKKYIRKVLNANPTLTNGSVTTEEESYFLGETFKTYVESKLGAFSGQDYTGILLQLKSGSLDFASFKKEAQTAESGWIFSQHLGSPSEWSANSSGEYPVTKLFKFVGLTEGEIYNNKVKVTIEDVKEPPNEFVKYGTFTVSIRNAEDNDLNPIYLERFTNLTLDPASQNFISKRIGDKYTVWDYRQKAFVEYGTYNNSSKFIRVVVNPDVESGLTTPGLLPFGFYGPVVLGDVTISGSGNTLSGGAATAFSSSFIRDNTSYNVGATTTAYTASFSLPYNPLVGNSNYLDLPALASVNWGLKTNYLTTKKYNDDLVDTNRVKPVNYPTSVETGVSNYAYVFSLDDVSGSVTGTGTSARLVSTPSASYWVQGNRKTYNSVTTMTSSFSGSSVLLKTYNRFTVPLLGGFEGVDITEKDPFNKRVLETNSGELTNYAYNSVKVAIESVADPEVVECNLMTIPGVENEGLTGLLLDKCETRGDALAIIDLKGDYVPEEGKSTAGQLASARKPSVNNVIENLKNRALNTSYGCAYFPWVLIKDTINDNTVWVPPSVAALGTFSTSQKRTELWFAPAGFNRGGLTDGAAGLPVIQTALRLSSKDRDDLYTVNINPIASFPSEGIVIFGQKTLQVTPSALDRINVRRLMIYLKKEISRFARTVLFDPNIQVTWKRFTNLADPFLASVQSRFGLSEYKVILDSTTTTPDLVDRNIVYAKILLKPTRAIEFIAIDFVITNTGASFND